MSVGTKKLPSEKPQGTIAEQAYAFLEKATDVLLGSDTPAKAPKPSSLYTHKQKTILDDHQVAANLAGKLWQNIKDFKFTQAFDSGQKLLGTATVQKAFLKVAAFASNPGAAAVATLAKSASLVFVHPVTPATGKPEAPLVTKATVPSSKTGSHAHAAKHEALAAKHATPVAKSLKVPNPAPVAPVAAKSVTPSTPAAVSESEAPVVVKSKIQKVVHEDHESPAAQIASNVPAAGEAKAVVNQPAALVVAEAGTPPTAETTTVPNPSRSQVSVFDGAYAYLAPVFSAVSLGAGLTLDLGTHSSSAQVTLGNGMVSNDGRTQASIATTNGAAAADLVNSTGSHFPQSHVPVELVPAERTGDASDSSHAVPANNRGAKLAQLDHDDEDARLSLDRTQQDVANNTAEEARAKLVDANAAGGGQAAGAYALVSEAQHDSHVLQSRNVTGTARDLSQERVVASAGKDGDSSDANGENARKANQIAFSDGAFENDAPEEILSEDIIQSVINNGANQHSVVS